MKRGELKRSKGLKRSGFKKKTKQPRTSRSVKMARKKKLCEDYGLPIIPCNRWGTGKNPTRLELLRGMAWTVFSAHIRRRDVGAPCITCGKPLAYGDIQAGHYAPVGNTSVVLHFMEENVNGEHPACNADFHGWHLVPMRKNMVERYGDVLVDMIDREVELKKSWKPTEDYFVDIIRAYVDSWQEY